MTPYSLSMAPDIAPRFDSSAWLTLALGVTVSIGLIAGFPGSLDTKILAMAILWLAAMASVRGDATHPYGWFGAAFVLYSCAGPLLHIIDLHPLDVWSGFLRGELNFALAMDLQYLGLLVCLVVIGPGRVRLTPASVKQGGGALFAGAMPVFLGAIMFAAISVAEIVAQGYTQKIDVVLYGSWVTKLGFGFNILATALVVVLARRFSENRPLQAYAILAAFAVAGVAVVMLTGERGFLFRTLVVTFLIIHIAHRRFSIGEMAIAALIGSVMIFVAGGLKMSFLGPEFAAGSDLSFEDIIGWSALSQDPGLANDPRYLQYAKLLLFMVLGSEFMTPGNNLALLVQHVPYDFPFQNGATLVYDVVRGLAPGFLLSTTQGQGSGLTFNNLLFAEAIGEGTGQGFSIVATGYLNFGTAGVVAVMGALALLLRILYRWAGRSSFGLFFYVTYVPTAVYTIRSDLSAPISQGLKHVALPLIAMLVIAQLRARTRRG